MMGAPRTFPRVIDILIKNAGKVVTLEQLTKTIGLTELQVRSAITENRRRVPFWHENINVLDRGRSWSLRPSAVSLAQDVVGTTTIGRLSATPTETESNKFIHDAERNGSVHVVEPSRHGKTKLGKPTATAATRKPEIGDLLEVIGYAGQDILARSEDSGQVYRVSKL